MKSLDTIGPGPGTWTARPCAAGVPRSFSIASAASSLRMNSWSASASSGPSARPPGERAFEDGADVVMHPAGATDVRVSREDEVHASVLMGLEQPPFNGQPNPSFHRVRFLRMIFRDEPRSRPAVDVHVARKNQGRARGCRGRERVVCEERDHPRPFRVRDRRRMDDHLHAADRIDNGFPRAKVRGDHLGPAGNPAAPPPGRTMARTWWPARMARRTTAPPISPLAPRTATRMHIGPSRPLKRMTPSKGRTAYVHDACTSPAYAAPATVAERPASVRRARCDR